MQRTTVMATVLATEPPEPTMAEEMPVNIHAMLEVADVSSKTESSM